MEASILLGSDETFSGPCFPGVLSLSFFLSVTIWVTSLGSFCEVAIFAELLFYPNVLGVTKWFITLPPLCRRPRGRIAQGKQVVMDANQAAQLCAILKPRVGIPTHYSFRGGAIMDGLFLQYFADPQRLPELFESAAAQAAPETRVVILPPGLPS